VNNLCADVGHLSLNKKDELLCGDHVEVVSKPWGEDARGFAIAVLADGLGSGVKANILSTLTSKIIATMMANSLTVEDCVATIAATLPVCKERGVAYSTFTIISINESLDAEIMQCDNPMVILLRQGKNFPYEAIAETIGVKQFIKPILK
jgi:hypothetical protein